MSNGLSPFGDNILYEQVYERQHEDLLIQEYIAFPRLGVQLTGGARHNEAIAFARRLKAALVRAGLPTVVFYRLGTDDNVHGHWANGKWEEKMTPGFAATWLADTAQGGLVPSYNNEPTAGTLAEIANHAKETLIYLEERKAPPIVALNWHTGFIPNLENRYGGVFDEVYSLIQERGDYAGFHGYMNTRFLDDPAKPLYIGRHRYVTKQFPRLKLVYTEFGFDSHLPNPQVNGYKTHKVIWQHEFPGVDPIDVYWNEAVKADTAILATENVIVLWYCRYTNGDPRWTAFNYADEAVLINRMKTYRRKPVTQTNWRTFNWGDRVDNARVELTAEVNIRSEPTTASADIGDLHDGDVVSYYKNTFRSGNYDWVKLVVGGVVECFAAKINGMKFMPAPTTEPIPVEGKVLIDVEDFNRILELDSIVEDAARQRLQIMGKYVPG